MKESSIERKLRQKVIARGGVCLKLAGTSEAGTPDRLLLLPSGRAVFVETKNEAGRISPRQAFMIKRLNALGFEAHVISSADEVDAFCDYLDGRRPGDKKDD